jgi:non-ribosomal peptide synthetase component F
VAAVEILAADEVSRLDALGNRAMLNAPAAHAESIPARFAAQVTRVPDAVAVTAGGRSLTYRELDEASNRLAHLLIEHGARPGRCVALLLPRSIEMVVSVLAVLKSGAAYLPLDAAHPDARIRFTVGDAGPVMALSTAELALRLAELDLPVIDVADSRIAAQPATALPAPGADEIAYLIYTSGTTGTPKGVMVAHRNVVQLLEVLGEYLPVSGVWSQCHTYGFDTSVWETSARCSTAGGCSWYRTTSSARHTSCTSCWSPSGSMC